MLSYFDSEPEPSIPSDSGAELAPAIDFFAKGRNHRTCRLLHRDKEIILLPSDVEGNRSDH
jgi:hypothetical protein